jgi:antitoxin component YwqK of YwqJK toxin-antitoxin module
MKTTILSSIIVTILIGCSTIDNKAKDETSVVKTISTKEYYSNGKIKISSEMSADSILNGLTTWFDSLGTKVGEQLYLNGKLNGLTKSFYGNGQIAKETEYLNDSIVKEKEFNIDGSFLYQYPIDTKDIGATKIVIANNSRNYFRKNTADTVEIFAANLPLTNKIVQTRNARLRPIGKDKYILTPMDKSHLVKIIIQLKKHKDDETYTPIDSTEIEIK